MTGNITSAAELGALVGEIAQLTHMCKSLLPLV